MALEDDKLVPNPVTGAAMITGRPTASSALRYRYSQMDSSGLAPEKSGKVYSVAPPTPGIAFHWTPIVIALVTAAALLVVFYSSALRQLVARWASDAGWSHGFVVPLIALFFIRLKWDTLRQLTPSGSVWGLGILLVGVCSQILFRATGLTHMSSLSMLVVLFGVVLFVFGWDYMKMLWLPISYLAFAIPPPTPLYVRVTMPMQILAAEFGAMLMPIFGGEGVRRGTVLDVLFPGYDPKQLNVEQACSGMRMLVAFFALAVALAYSTDRPVWQKVSLAICALPIAIFCNGLRVTLTGVMAVKVDPRWAEGNAHEYFGLLMLIPALLMQLGLAWVLDRLFLEEPESLKGGRA